MLQVGKRCLQILVLRYDQHVPHPGGLTVKRDARAGPIVRLLAAPIRRGTNRCSCSRRRWRQTSRGRYDDAGRAAALPEIVGDELRRILGVGAGGAAVAAVEWIRARVGWPPHRVNVAAQANRFVGRDEADGVGDAEVVAPLAVSLALPEGALRKGNIGARRRMWWETGWRRRGRRWRGRRWRRGRW